MLRIPERLVAVGEPKLQLPGTGDAGKRLPDLIRSEGFGEIVLRAAPHRLHRSIDRRMGCENDDRQVGCRLQQLRQHVQTVFLI